MAPVNKPKHKGKALVAGATAGILGMHKIFAIACFYEMPWKHEGLINNFPAHFPPKLEIEICCTVSILNSYVEDNLVFKLLSVTESSSFLLNYLTYFRWVGVSK